MAKQQLTPKTEDMSKWYTQVIQQAKLADYSPVKGSMVIRPNGYSIWESIQKKLDGLFKELDIQNAYFPIFIPISFLKKEAKHVEGFAPELAVVTHAGGEKLEEELVVRPTSETIMYDMYSKWVQSYRDLPILINQWNNVVRWEKRTYFFLRTTEFLWQEAHTAHATHEEEWNMVLEGLESYRKVAEELLAIPVIKGRKSDSERFAGAVVTTTIEAIMPDGKALQAGTSHDLGQNFSKKEAFNISFLNEKSETEYAWQTSFGLSTRIIGALVMVHGDNDGLVLPPRAASVQVSIIPVDDSLEIMEMADTVYKKLKAAGVRVKKLGNTEHRLGWRLNESEIQGIPVALVIGKKEVADKAVTAKIRHNHEEKMLALDSMGEMINELLEEIQMSMLMKAKKNQEELTSTTESYEEFKKIMSEKRGFIKAFWCEDEMCEKQIKDETKATTRCLPFTDEKGSVLEESGVCIKCGKPATHRWLFAQAY
jgi:prolyl-tRNA synthetase